MTPTAQQAREAAIRLHMVQGDGQDLITVKAFIDHAEKLEAENAKLREGLTKAVRLSEIIRKVLVMSGPPARLKLSTGKIVTGEAAEIFESLAMTVIAVGDEAAALMVEGGNSTNSFDGVYTVPASPVLVTGFCRAAALIKE